MFSVYIVQLATGHKIAISATARSWMVSAAGRQGREYGAPGHSGMGTILIVECQAPGQTGAIGDDSAGIGLAQLGQNRE